MTWNVVMALTAATNAPANTSSGSLTVAGVVSQLIRGTILSVAAGSLLFASGGFNPNRIGNSGGFSPNQSGGVPVFQDRMMESRGFMTAANANTFSTVDSNGWPTGDWQTYLAEVQNYSSTPSWLSGTFKCGFTSKNGGAETITGSSCTISNKVINGNLVTFDLVATSGAPNIKVTGTTGGTTSVFFMLPGYNTNTSYNISGDETKLFTTEFLSLIKKLGIERGLDWSWSLFATSSVTSSNRHTPSNVKCNIGWNATDQGLSGPYDLTDGWPLEWLIALCNQTNNDLYWCVPINSDSTYVTAIATLIKSKLNSNLRVYIEFCNELWNGKGVGGGYYAGVVNAYNTANPGFLNYDSASDQTTLNARYLAYRLKGIYDGFNAVFGSDMGVRVFMVVAWQTGGNGLNTFDLFYKFMVHQYGSVSPYIHYNAIAPYMTRDLSSVPSDGVNHINSNDTIAQIQAQYTTAGSYYPFLSYSESNYIQGREAGLLGLLTYESGREIAGETTAVVNYGAALLDSGFVAVMQNYIQTLTNCGFSAILNTSWGIVNTNSVLDPQYAMATDPASFESSGSAIYNALIGYQSGLPSPTRNVVSGSGSTVDAINYTDNNSVLNGTYQYYGQINSSNNGAKYGVGGYIGWVINCTAPGTYALAIKHDSGSTSGTINVTCNGSAVATGVTIPSGLSNGSVSIGNVTLVAGPNRIIAGNGTTWGPTNPIKPKQLVFT